MVVGLRRPPMLPPPSEEAAPHYSLVLDARGAVQERTEVCSDLWRRRLWAVAAAPVPIRAIAACQSELPARLACSLPSAGESARNDGALGDPAATLIHRPARRLTGAHPWGC